MERTLTTTKEPYHHKMTNINDLTIKGADLETTTPHNQVAASFKWKSSKEGEHRNMEYRSKHNLAIANSSGLGIMTCNTKRS
jgi:hypothetical protein